MIGPTSLLRVVPVPVDLVVTDLDGTLWDGAVGTHPLTLAALARLREAGLPVLAATARRPAAALEVMTAHDVLLPAVVFDGALGHDFVSRQVFHRAPIGRDAAEAVVHEFADCGLEPCLNIDGDARDFLVGPQPSTHPDHLAYNAGRTQLVDIVEATRRFDVLSMIICGGDRRLLTPVQEAIAPLADSAITIDRTYGGHSLSVRAKGISKWSGVEAYCQLRELDPSRVLAVGDAENDLELLTRAAYRCVPEDGCDAALALATHRIPPARVGGWATILEVIGMSERRDHAATSRHCPDEHRRR